MPSVWEDGHVSVAALWEIALWEMFAQYPYLTRLSDRRGWEFSTFALAAGVDEATGRYVDLRLPGDPAGVPVTGTTLLVYPNRAIAQRNRELEQARVVSQPTGDGEQPAGPGERRPEDRIPPHPHPSVPRPAPAKTHFFGVHRLDAQKYGRDFAVVVDEVLQRLSAADLEVRLEISATARDGFGDDVVRTVSENAGILRFAQAGFEVE